MHILNGTHIAAHHEMSRWNRCWLWNGSFVREMSMFFIGKYRVPCYTIRSFVSWVRFECDSGWITHCIYTMVQKLWVIREVAIVRFVSKIQSSTNAGSRESTPINTAESVLYVMIFEYAIAYAFSSDWTAAIGCFWWINRRWYALIID